VPEIKRMTDTEVAALRKELDGIKVRRRSSACLMCASPPAQQFPQRQHCSSVCSPVHHTVQAAAAAAPEQDHVRLQCAVAEDAALNLQVHYRVGQHHTAPLLLPLPQVRGKNPPRPIRAWTQSGVSSKVLEILRKQGFDRPLAIQAQVRCV
jgi:hypothetical protein